MAVTFHEKLAPREILQEIADKRGPILTLPADAKLLATAGIRDVRPLVNDGWLEPLGRKGLYRIREVSRPLSMSHLALVPALMGDAPYYVSWWSAFVFHDLTEQLPRTVSVAVQSKRRDAEIGGIRVRFVRVSPKKFFGYRTVKTEGALVAVATPEKAIIDSLDRPAYSGGLAEVAKALSSRRVRSEELIRIARRYGVRAVAQRLGWLLENLRGEDASALLEMVNPGAPYLLNPVGETTGAIDRRWGLRINTSIRNLSAWQRS